MYEVSEAYKTAMQRSIQQQKLSGTIASPKGAWTRQYTSDNIIKGSFTLTNQCSDNDEVGIGKVYAAELKCTFTGIDIERYQWLESILTPMHELKTSNGFESIPLGVFTIKEADWTNEGVEITAYDYMVKLDKTCSIKTTQGSIYDFLTMAANACHIELAQTEAEISALPNASVSLVLFTENDIETWRDFVSWCAQTTGTFATFNREGKLELRTYGVTPVDEIGSNRRIIGSKFSDFETRYTGMSCVNISEKSTTYYSILPDDGLTYNLGSNPLLQTGFDDVLEAQRRAVLNALTVIDYVPFEVSMIGTPAYDLGDIVVFSGGIADGDKISCITKYDWKYGGEYTITGVGQNPELASAKSKSDKNLTGLMKSGEENKIQYYTFTNSDDIHIEDGDTRTIINIRFQCTQETIAVFHAEILLDVDTTVDGITYTDAKGRILYYFNNELVSDYKPVEVWFDGKHMLHLLYYFNLQTTQVNDFDVRLNMSGGDADIPQMSIKAAIYGQNLYATDKFDGTIKIEESFSGISANIPTITSIADMRETVTNDMYTRMVSTLNDNLATSATIRGITVTTISSDTVEVDTE